MDRWGDFLSRSKFVWLLVYSDGTTVYVKAQTIYQMVNYSEINFNEVINIIRMDVVGVFTGITGHSEVIEIPSEY